MKYTITKLSLIVFALACNNINSKNKVLSEKAKRYMDIEYKQIFDDIYILKMIKYI